MGIRKGTTDFESTTDAVPVASDIYEREEFDAQGIGGSVTSDIAGMTLDEMEAYFLDADPAAYI